MIRNIVWDVDGTLFDTYPAITYALSKSLNRMGMPVALNMIDGLVRQSFRHCIATLCRRYKVDADVLRKHFTEVYQAVPLENQPPLVGAREVCQWIAERGGANVAVIYREGGDVRRLFAVHNLEPFFTGANDVSPDMGPGFIKTVLKKCRLDGGETLVIGDRELNLCAGREAGCQTCSYGYESPSGQVDIFIKNYSQLLAKLQAQDR